MKNNDKVMDKDFAEFFLNGMNNLRQLMLKSEKHIKKYYKYRKVHGEVLDSMQNYIYNNKYDLSEELNKILDIVKKEVKGNVKVLNINFDLNNSLDLNKFLDLCVYKNHPNMNCVVDEYLTKNKFKNPDKVEMLYAMRDSFASFFKVIDKDYNGFVKIEDLVTNKVYKVVDISLSNPIFKNSPYLYCRLITINDINFLSGTMAFPKNIKKINNYIKNCKYKKKSGLVETLEVYNLNKEYGLEITINNID